MALTVGGEETAESKNLSANETYKVGVSAYTQTEDGAKYYSAETESSGVFLPEYTPLNLALSVNGKDCTPDENGVYHAYVGGSSNSLAVTCAESESITVTRMDTDAPLTSDGANTFAIPDFTGTLTDCNEGTLEWVPKPEVENLPIWQGDKIFLRLLAEGAPFFHLELTYHGDTLVQAVLEGETLPCG